MNSAKKRPIKIRVFVEITLFSSIPVLIDLALQGELLRQALFVPFYSIIFVLFFSFYNFIPAFIGVILATTEGVALSLYYIKTANITKETVFTASTFHVLLAGLIFCILAAFVRNRVLIGRKRFLERYKQAVHRVAILEKRISILERVHEVLENRVSSQKDSITLLHDRVKKLASLNLDEALNTILDTIALFTEMSVGEIWRLNEEQNLLVPAAVYGWSTETTQSASRSLEGTIEGYVFRNKQPFSVRMLLNSAEFDRFDTRLNILTIPITISGKAWGVLNIQKLPFEHYSQYTESILEILLSLAEPYLRHIVEYEQLQNQQELDSITGYPLFTLLYKNLEDDIERTKYEGGSVSLIIMEIVNFDELELHIDRNQLRRLPFELKEMIDQTKRIKSKAFHYKDDNQIALLVYGLDHDGASFFCLDVLALLSGYTFSANSQNYPVELILGFSTATNANVSVDSMVAEAEHLLSVQRL
ncbi:MAG: GAF domain-containing protein [Treponema sp.]|nr:GAF domain-containing protein [Treponema sp.]